MGCEARARRDESADDDILLEAAQIVFKSPHRGFGQHAGGLLERRRGDERLGREGGLGDAQQHRLQPCRLLAVVFRTIVDVERARAVELLAAQQRRLAGLLHLGLAQHLADDHLDVLVVDLHTLQAVDVLDLAHQVVRQRLDALQAQDVMRGRLARSGGLRPPPAQPPGMARVLEASCGMRAMTSPTDTRAPSSRLTSAPGGSVYTAGISVLAKVTSLPLPLSSLMVARTSLPPRCLVSSTTVLDRPVTSSTCEVTVMPSTKSWNFTRPATSVTTGWVCGSQVATTWPAATVAPSLELMMAPYGIL